MMILFIFYFGYPVIWLGHIILGIYTNNKMRPGYVCSRGKFAKYFVYVFIVIGNRGETEMRSF